MSEILVGWWWSFWNFSALISFLVKGGYRDKALCFSPKNQHMVPSSSPWKKKEENPVVTFRLLFSTSFCSSFRWSCWLPAKHRERLCLHRHSPRNSRAVGERTLVSVYWWCGYILSLLFCSAEDCSSISCCNSVISQTKEAETESIICSSWVSFLFLSQSSSTEEALATSSALVFCHGKKIETQEQENMILLWSQAKLAFFETYKYLFFFVNPFIEEG